MENLYTLESYVQNVDQKLFELKKSLEIFTGQEIKALQMTVVKIFEIIGTDVQGENVQ